MSDKPSKVGQKFILFRSNKNQVVKKEKTEKKNVQVDELINLLMNKIDSLKIDSNFNNNIYDEKNNKNLNVVDIDFKKEIYIDKAEINKVTSEEVKGKVNNKLDKLKALRKRNGS